MGDASSVGLVFGEEATFGDPASVTSWRSLRFTGEDLRFERGEEDANEIDPDRQPTGSDPTSKSTSGGINTKLSLVAPAASPGNGYDPLYEGAMMSTWSTLVALTGRSIDISGVGGGGIFTLTDAAAANAFANVVLGQWVRLSGFDVNGVIYACVTNKVSNNVVECVGVREAGAAVTNEAGQTDIAVQASMLRIGKVKKSYSIERQYLDLSPVEYALYTGQWVGSWRRDVAPDAIVTERFDFRGKVRQTRSGVTETESIAAKWATPRINAVDDIRWLMEGSFGAISAECVTRIAHTLDNRPRIDLCISKDGPEAVGIGNPLLTGQFNTFMNAASGAALMRKQEQRTFSKLAYLIDDGTRRQLVTVHNLLFRNVEAPAQSAEGPVEISAEWSARPDAGTGVAFQIDRF